MVNLVKGIKVSVLGLGRRGLSCVNYLQTKGIQPLIMDTRQNPPQVTELPNSLTCHCGSLDIDQLLTSDLIVVSPGTSLATYELQQAQQAGIEIIGDTELFAIEINSQPDPAPIIAITGSNGKSTVTDLLGEMAKIAGIHAGIGGNFDIPTLELLNKDYALYILELSSFQLETTYSLRPTAATILNITPDHMDRHVNLTNYIKIKHRIYRQAKHCIANYDDSLTWPNNKQSITWFGVKQGDYCLDSLAESALLCHGHSLLTTEQIMLKGQHNQLNILAALALAEKVGIKPQQCSAILTNYKGLPHCCELVAVKLGVHWVNDSKATNIGSTMAALNSIKNKVTGKIHLIAGGDSKNADLTELSDIVNLTVTELYCFGCDSAKLAALKKGAHQVMNLDQAVTMAANKSSYGDWVLLSPACSSLDMYDSFRRRGEHFRNLVEAL